MSLLQAEGEWVTDCYFSDLTLQTMSMSNFHKNTTKTKTLSLGYVIRWVKYGIFIQDTMQH